MGSRGLLAGGRSVQSACTSRIGVACAEAQRTTTAAAGLSEESKLAKLEAKCCDVDARACVKLLKTRLELAEAKGAAYLPGPAIDRYLYAGEYTWAGVKELLVAAA
jgi:hypothetical protein